MSLIFSCIYLRVRERFLTLNGKMKFPSLCRIKKHLLLFLQWNTQYASVYKIKTVFFKPQSIYLCVYVYIPTPPHTHTHTHIFSSVQSLICVQLSVTPWTAARQATPPPPSITNSCSLLKLMSIKSVMPSNHLILFSPLLLPPSIFPSIRVFSNESVLHIR